MRIFVLLFLLSLLMFSVSSEDIVAESQAAVIEKTGIVTKLLRRVQAKVSSMIDTVSHDLTRQYYSRFYPDLLENYPTPQSLLRSYKGQQIRSKLNAIVLEIQILFTPVAKWSLSHPYFKPPRVRITPEHVEAKNKILGEAGEASESVMSRLKSLFNFKNYFKPSTISAIKKRMVDSSLEEKTQYLLTYQQEFHRKNPTASWKEKLKFGWTFVTTKVFQENSLSKILRIQKRDSHDAIGSLFMALQNAFDESLTADGELNYWASQNGIVSS